MGVTGSIISFLIIWWTVLFAILPMRVKGQWETDADQVEGTESGAPDDPQLWFKAKRTTWVTFIIWAIVFLVVNSGVFGYDR